MAGTATKARVIESGVSWSVKRETGVAIFAEHRSPAYVEVSSDGDMRIMFGGPNIHAELSFALPATTLLRRFLNEPQHTFHGASDKGSGDSSSNGCICRFHKSKNCPVHKNDKDAM